VIRRPTAQIFNAHYQVEDPHRALTRVHLPLSDRICSVPTTPAPRITSEISRYRFGDKWARVRQESMAAQ